MRVEQSDRLVVTLVLPDVLRPRPNQRWIVRVYRFGAAFADGDL